VLSDRFPSVSIFILNTSLYYLTCRRDVGLVLLARTYSKIDTNNSIIISVVYS
jgi:hypothetical protein